MTVTRVRDLIVAHVGAGENVATIPTALEYTAADPYAVRIVFMQPDVPPVAWHVSRGLFVTALATGTAGEGDVQITRHPSGVFGIHLRTADGCATAFTVIGPVRRFLGKTWQVVPPGTESRCLDVDALITRIFDEEARRG